MERIARRQILDYPCRRVYTQTIARADLLHIVANLKERQTDVDAIAIEDACEACRNHDRYARCRNRNRRVLTRGATAEVFPADHDIARHDLLGKRRIDVLHAVRCECLRLERVEIARRDNYVRINVVAVAPDLPLEHHATSSGAAIRPSIALAAATCGPAR